MVRARVSQPCLSTWTLETPKPVSAASSESMVLLFSSPSRSHTRAHDPDVVTGGWNPASINTSSTSHVVLVWEKWERYHYTARR